jgi:hypothetical protein
MVRKSRIFSTLLLPASVIGAGLFGACSDDSNIGPSLISDQMTIYVDSNFTIEGKSISVLEMDARSTTTLLGKIDISGYGKLNSSFVTQLLSAGSMEISDTIPVDSVVGMKLKLHFRRGALTGDSLAPCQVKVYALEKQLPQNIQSSFDPTGYYDPSKPLGVKSYTASALGMTDTLYYQDLWGHIMVDMPLDLAKKFFLQYRQDPSVFQWPSTFNNYFPGLYVENAFGSGCVVNISVGEMTTYYHYGSTKRVYNETTEAYETVPIAATDSVTLFGTAPEVVSSSCFSYKPDAALVQRAQSGEPLIITPCGYLTEIHIPAQEILNRYNSQTLNLSVINNLTLNIPVNTVKNAYSLMPSPYLLMVRKCDYESFFAGNKIPDNTEKSFWSTYDSSTSSYTFTSMRQYIVDLMKAGEPVKDEDMDFLLVPVTITTETVSNTVYVTDCVQFINRPTLCAPDLKNAKLMFTFSTKK